MKKLLEWIKNKFRKNDINIDIITIGVDLPKRMTSMAAGYDVCASENTIIRPGRNRVPIGIYQQFDKKYECQVEARSGFSLNGFEAYAIGDFDFKKPLRIDADVISGKGDADYTGEYGVFVKSYEKECFVVKKGTRIAQITYVEVKNAKFNKVLSLQNTSRGSGAYGHTGTYAK